MDNINDIEDFDVKIDVTSESSTKKVEKETTNSESNFEKTEKDAGSTPAPESVNTTEAAEETTRTSGPEQNTEYIDKLLAQIEMLKRQNEELMKKFDEKIAQDEHKAQLFDKMYGELQKYKTDLYAKLLKPFILNTITLIDDTNMFVANLGENDSASAEKYLRAIPDDLIYILESNGVELYETEGEKFNPKTQRAMKQVPAENPEQDNCIAKRVRKGYNWNGVTLKPEFVWVYKYKA